MARRPRTWRSRPSPAAAGWILAAVAAAEASCPVRIDGRGFATAGDLLALPDCPFTSPRRRHVLHQYLAALARSGRLARVGHRTGVYRLPAGA